MRAAAFVRYEQQVLAGRIPARPQVERPVAGHPLHYAAAHVGNVNILETPAGPIRDERDAGIERSLFSRQIQHHLVGEAMRHAPHFVAVALVAAPADLFLLRDVEQARHDHQPVAFQPEGAFHQGQGVQHRPVGKIDVRNFEPVRGLDVRPAGNQSEQARQFQVSRQDVGEGFGDVFVLGAGRIGERRHGYRHACPPGLRDLDTNLSPRRGRPAHQRERAAEKK